MDAKKCDRCGSFYIKNTSSMIDATNVNRLYLKELADMASKDKFMDLCPECKHDLDMWWVFKEAVKTEEE